MEGSLTRRGKLPSLRAEPRLAGLFQSRPQGRVIYPDSGSETAFLVKYGTPYARAAQRRPGAEHRARPGLPELAPLTSGKRVRCTPRADRRQESLTTTSGGWSATWRAGWAIVGELRLNHHVPLWC